MARVVSPVVSMTAVYQVESVVGPGSPSSQSQQSGLVLRLEASCNWLHLTPNCWSAQLAGPGHVGLGVSAAPVAVASSLLGLVRSVPPE